MDRPTAPEHRDTVAAESPGPQPLLDTAHIVMRPIGLSIDVATSVEGLRALKPDYERLERAAGNTLPFNLHEWHLSWCEHLLNRHPQREEQLQLFVLRNRSGDCVGIVPLVLSKWHVGPVQLSTMGFLGVGDQGITEIRGALIEPGYESPAMRCLYQRVNGLPGWKWLQWSDANDALAAALTLELRPHWHEARWDCILDLPPSWREFRARLPRNAREALRHCYNSLRRAGYEFDCVVARQRAEVLQALPRFFELHALRAGMSWGPQHRNYFESPMLQEFMRDVCASLATRDVVRIFQLRIAGAVVASRLGFVVGDSLYLYYSGFDPAWARYAVMTTTEAEAFRYAIAQGIRSVNLSPTAVRSKLRWRPRLTELRSCLVHRNALSSRLACRTYCLAASSRALPLRLLRRLLRARLGWL